MAVTQIYLLLHTVGSSGRRGWSGGWKDSFLNRFAVCVFRSSLGLFQVRVGDEVPATVTPIKPKHYLLGNLTVKQQHAVKLC